MKSVRILSNISCMHFLKIILILCCNEPLFFHGQCTLRAINASITIQQGTTINVQGGVTLSFASLVMNDGSIVLTEDWANNSSIGALSANMGLVDFIGNDQNIGGSSVTEFNKLQFSGAGTKNLESSIFVDSNLSLFDARLLTNHQFCWVKNTALEAITWNSGFVETNFLDGSLQRNMINTSENYAFPLGNELLNQTYRPILAKSQSNTTNCFAANLTLGSVDYNNGNSVGLAQSPFASNQLNDSLSFLNPNFFHTFTPVTANSQEVQISIPYFLSDESGSKAFDDIAHFNLENSVAYKWNPTNALDLNSLNLSAFNNPEKAKRAFISNFISDVFVLASSSDDFNEIVFIPNTFTPDGDEHNNIFGPLFSSDIDPTSYSLLIFNRWGEIVFETKDTNFGWDGTYLNQMVKDGSYVWKMSFKTKSSARTNTYQGHVTLLR